MRSTLPSRGDVGDALVDLEARWTRVHLLRGDEDLEHNASPPFATLDADCIRAVAAACPTAVMAWRCSTGCLDIRQPAVAVLASVNSFTRSSLTGQLVDARVRHATRITELEDACRLFGTSLASLRASRDLMTSRGEAECVACRIQHPYFGGLFRYQPLEVAGVVAAAATNTNAEADANGDSGNDGAEEGERICLVAGQLHCAHCWRCAHELSMRPGATGEEQDWEAPIEEGTWMLVEDFSSCSSLDSPLLIRAEYSHVLAAGEGLGGDGGVLELLRSSMACSGYAVFLRAPLQPRSIPLLADLIASGYAHALLALELERCGLDDTGLALLSNALVGNALYVQYLSVGRNPIGDAGVCALAAALSPRKRMLATPAHLAWAVNCHRALRALFLTLRRMPRWQSISCCHYAGGCT